MDPILQPLNEKQREAVTATKGPYLILAGPGSGETRVITHRFAYLLKTEHIDPHSILAVTFTNKAANEMKERIEKLIHINCSGLWIRTFHSMGYRILREYAHLLGYEKQWEAIDENDSLKMIRKILKEIPYYSEFSKLYKPENLLSLISKAKEELKSIAEVTGKRIYSNREKEFLEDIYRLYEKKLKETQLMDYSDLLANTYLILKNFPEVLSYYQNLWQYIMVDEFQDTNRLQYDIVSLLAQKHKNILIVGDDDQSIYGWRGARVTNMRLFEEQFQATIIKLEQNYRSTETIIKAANSIAEAIDDRMGKTLWTENEDGPPIVIMYGGDERSLYEQVVEKIKSLKHSGYAYKDIAIFYRINAQSGTIEELLIKHEIPYHIVGSLRFFERKEIKDVIAYVAFLANPLNVIAFERIIDFPPRGIGDATIEKLLLYSQENHCDILSAMQQASLIPGIGAKAKILQNLAQELSELREQIDVVLPSTFLRILLNLIPLEEHWKKQDEVERWENIQALVDAARVFEESNPGSTIVDFLNYATLNSTEENIKDTDHVSLMTIHNAKGLEFRAVFVLGVVDGLIPLSRSAETPWGENEEKRLFYVAVTRAKERLVLCVPSRRYTFGETVRVSASPYLDYIPDECIKEEDFTSFYSTMNGKNFSTDQKKRNSLASHQMTPFSQKGTPPAPGKPATFENLQPGVKIRHRILGEGEVVQIVGKRVMIEFENGAIQLLDGNFLSSIEVL
ncbi:MAG: ATP-dependent helicase [Brevinematales bacterium]